MVVNKPASLRNINEKVYTSWFPDCVPASLITRDHDELKRFLAEQKKIVLKPLDGMGGQSIFVVALGDLNANVIFETLTGNGSRFTIAPAIYP